MKDTSPAQIFQKEAFWSLVGSIGWLASSTRPDLSAIHSFLALYSNKPLVGHMKAALHALSYIHLMHDYGISFMEDALAPMHSFIHFPPRILKPTKMQFRQRCIAICLRCLHTSMLAGDCRSVMLWLTVPSFCCSSFGARAVVSSSAPAAL